MMISQTCPDSLRNIDLSESLSSSGCPVLKSRLETSYPHWDLLHYLILFGQIPELCFRLGHGRFRLLLSRPLFSTCSVVRRYGAELPAAPLRELPRMREMKCELKRELSCLRVYVFKQHAMQLYGGEKVSLHQSWPRYYREVSGQFHVTVALPQEKNPRYTLGRRLVGPRAGLDAVN